MMRYNELDVYSRLCSEQNIFMALYSVESYITERELLDAEDKRELNVLKDKFNKTNIVMWVKKVQNRLDELFKKDQFLKAKVFFKPKKYDEKRQKVIFRPLHSADLLDQITAVAMLNMLIYDYDDNNVISMSNLSRLIPHNFYGNRVAYEPEKLFKPWQEQYKKYTTQANEYYKHYHENGEYKWEANLDLKNFFPSINPICLYNYVFQQMPVNYSETEKSIFGKILEKLIFVEIECCDKSDLAMYLEDNKFDYCRFAMGLPQGLPQSYFLANLFMVEIEKIYRTVLPGKMVFYVDDSIIFTNAIKDIDDFEEKIKKINTSISEWLDTLYLEKNSYISSELIEFVQERKDLYGIRIHSPGDKSTISNIAESKKGEIYIHCIGRETSKTAFDMNNNFSDEESRILHNKTECILEVIDKELDQINNKLENENLEEDRESKEAYKKKLIRYKKFFKYRNKDLQYRENSDTQLLQEDQL